MDNVIDELNVLSIQSKPIYRSMTMQAWDEQIKSAPTEEDCDPSDASARIINRDTIKMRGTTAGMREAAQEQGNERQRPLSPNSLLHLLHEQSETLRAALAEQRQLLSEFAKLNGGGWPEGQRCSWDDPHTDVRVMCVDTCVLCEQ